MTNQIIKAEYLKARNLQNADITISEKSHLIIIRDYTTNGQMETFFMYKTEIGKLKNSKGIAKVNYIDTDFGINKNDFKNEFVN
jgi:hypothetical protein